jgi:hypothetical protein
MFVTLDVVAVEKGVVVGESAPRSRVRLVIGRRHEPNLPSLPPVFKMCFKQTRRRHDAWKKLFLEEPTHSALPNGSAVWHTDGRKANDHRCHGPVTLAFFDPATTGDELLPVHTLSVMPWHQ